MLSTGTDGMTISTAVDTILDGRQALIAVGMNGQPLPTEHGFPARMLVPGLYGYVSATKWVTKLEVTTFARQKAYWTQRGYAARRRSRPSRGSTCRDRWRRSPAGRVAVAGVAWAPHRGISRVQVNVDNGPWRTATAGRRGRHRHLAAVGVGLGCGPRPAHPAGPRHRRHGRCPDQERARVFPSGATGWDSVVVTVT